MDNPEIKALLKSAKDSIKSKDLQKALKTCKVVYFLYLFYKLFKYSFMCVTIDSDR